MTSRSTGQVLEIACDESGSEGEKLIGGETDVFAHASVRLDVQTATECIQEIRDRIRSPALEYKSNHLLRTKHRPVLEWLLLPAGPSHGHAHVHLTDKAFFAVRKVIDLLVGGVASTAGTGSRRAEVMARTLYGEGRRAFGRERWEDLLGAFNDLLRVKNRQGVGISVDSFFRMVDSLCLASGHGRLREIMELLRHARPRVDALRAKLLDNPIASEALNHRGDAQLTALLRPYVDLFSIWGDDRSWSLLALRS